MAYKVLVVGSGGHALNHWRGHLNIHEAFEVSGVVDVDTELLEHASELWGVEEDATATTIDQALETGIKADVALICTPIYTHHGISIEALRNGLHVICEKNMAQSMQAGIEMTKCALEHPKLVTVVGHQYPFWRSSNWAIRKAIGTGRLGKLNNIQCSFNPAQPSYDPTTPTRTGWRRFLDHDYLEDWAIHTLDLFRYFSAMDAIVVSADLWRPPWIRRFGTSSINVRMLMANPAEYEGEDPLVYTEATDRARRLWQNGKAPSSWIHAQYVGHSDGMGGFENEEHWLIRGSRGSIEYQTGRTHHDEIRMLTHDFDLERIDTLKPNEEVDIHWTESNLRPYPVDLECGTAAQWKGDNTEDEWGSGCFLLEEIKQGIESGGKIKPTRSFENCLKTLSIAMGTIESSRHGGTPIFLPDLWEIPRES